MATHDTRARAIDGLRLIAQMEEHIAAEIDEPGYFGELAGWLRRSADRRRGLAAELGASAAPGIRPGLALVES